MTRHLVTNIILSTIILASFTTSYSQQIVSDNLQNVKKSCQCPKCNLNHIDLQQFKPGSIYAKDNPFITSSGPITTDSCSLNCDLKNANLHGANLSYSNFTACIRGYITPLKSADFTNANLTNAKIQYAIFKNVQFDNADLSQSNLSHSDFFLVDFAHADLSYSNLRFIKSTADAMHGWGSDFSYANLSHADLTKADIYANFEGANFSYANLKNSHLSTSEDAGMWKYQTESRLWRNVNFTFANLKGATLTPADLTGAILCHTIMPDGLESNRDCK